MILVLSRNDVYRPPMYRILLSDREQDFMGTIL